MYREKEYTQKQIRNSAASRRTFLRSLNATGTGMLLGGTTAVSLESGNARAEPEIIEDFERGTPLGDYSGNTSLYTIATSSSKTIEGENTLEAMMVRTRLRRPC